MTTATTGLDRIRERQRIELDAIGAVGREQKKIDGLEAKIAASWTAMAGPLRELQRLGWSVKDIADVVDVDPGASRRSCAAAVRTARPPRDTRHRRGDADAADATA